VDIVRCAEPLHAANPLPLLSPNGQNNITSLQCPFSLPASGLSELTGIFKIDMLVGIEGETPVGMKEDKVTYCEG